MNCQYYGKFGVYRCEEDALDGEEYCILHLPIPDVHDTNYSNILKLKYEKINEKIAKNDFKFVGVIMHGLTINRRKINGDIDFSDANIKGYLNFRNNYIIGNVSIGNATIDGNVDFEGSIIENDVNFMLLKSTTESISFRNSTIFGNVHFDGANIEGYLDFEYATIDKKADFNFEKVAHDAIFKNITVNGRANFNGIEVGGYISLEWAHIHGALDFVNSLLGTSDSTPDGYDSQFTGMNIYGEVDFTGTKFFGEAQFLKCYFRENTYYNGTIFNKIADFTETRFYENVDFIETKFRNSCNFEKASFLSTGVFEDLNEFDAIFVKARLKNVAFRNCDLVNVHFKNVIFENCELSNSKLPNKIIEHEEYIKTKNEKIKRLNLSKNSVRLFNFFKVPLIPEMIDDAKNVADTYRRLRQCLQNQGAYDKAGDFYIKEMDMKREVYAQDNKILWILYNLLWISSSYGERPSYLAVWLITIVIILLLTGVINSTNSDAIPPAIPTAIISFLISLFVYVFARKMAR